MGIMGTSKVVVAATMIAGTAYAAQATFDDSVQLLIVIVMLLVLPILYHYAIRGVGRAPKATYKPEANEIGRSLWYSEPGHLNVFPNQPNPRPVVGVLAQEITSSERWGTAEEQFNVTDDSIGYVEAAYVKWLESCGALVMPIPLSTSKDDLLDLMQNHLSGLVLPGSKTGPVNKRLFLGLLNNAMEFTITKETNIPIFGICMGHQIIYQALITAKKSKYAGLEHYSRLVNINNTEMINLNVEITEPQARIIGGITDKMIQSLATDRVVLHNHKWGMTRKMLQEVEGLTTVAIAKNNEGCKCVGTQRVATFRYSVAPRETRFHVWKEGGGKFQFHAFEASHRGFPVFWEWFCRYVSETFQPIFEARWCFELLYETCVSGTQNENHDISYLISARLFFRVLELSLLWTLL